MEGGTDQTLTEFIEHTLAKNVPTDTANLVPYISAIIHKPKHYVHKALVEFLGEKTDDFVDAVHAWLEVHNQSKRAGKAKDTDDRQRPEERKEKKKKAHKEDRTKERKKRQRERDEEDRGHKRNRGSPSGGEERPKRHKERDRERHKTSHPPGAGPESMQADPEKPPVPIATDTTVDAQDSVTLVGGGGDGHTNFVAQPPQQAPPPQHPEPPKPYEPENPGFEEPPPPVPVSAESFTAPGTPTSGDTGIGPVLGTAPPGRLMASPQHLVPGRGIPGRDPMGMPPPYGAPVGGNPFFPHEHHNGPPPRQPHLHNRSMGLSMGGHSHGSIHQHVPQGHQHVQGLPPGVVLGSPIQAERYNNVIELRNVPVELNTIVQLSSYFSKFGNIESVNVFPIRNQAAVRMTELKCAKQAVTATEPVMGIEVITTQLQVVDSLGRRVTKPLTSGPLPLDVPGSLSGAPHMGIRLNTSIPTPPGGIVGSPTLIPKAAPKSTAPSPEEMRFALERQKMKEQRDALAKKIQWAKAAKEEGISLDEYTAKQKEKEKEEEAKRQQLQELAEKRAKLAGRRAEILHKYPQLAKDREVTLSGTATASTVSGTSSVSSEATTGKEEGTAKPKPKPKGKKGTAAALPDVGDDKTRMLALLDTKLDKLKTMITALQKKLNKLIEEGASQAEKDQTNGLLKDMMNRQNCTREKRLGLLREKQSGAEARKEQLKGTSTDVPQTKEALDKQLDELKRKAEEEEKEAGSVEGESGTRADGISEDGGQGVGGVIGGDEDEHGHKDITILYILNPPPLWLESEEDVKLHFASPGPPPNSVTIHSTYLELEFPTSDDVLRATQNSEYDGVALQFSSEVPQQEEKEEEEPLLNLDVEE